MYANNVAAMTQMVKSHLEYIRSLPPEQAKVEGLTNLRNLGLIDEDNNYLVAFIPRNNHIDNTSCNKNQGRSE